MKKNLLLLYIISFTSILLFSCTSQKPVIIGYVGGYRGIVKTDSIDVWRLSHINYAFVDISNNRAWLHNESTDTINLRKLSALKNINNNLKIMISIGGWTWSKNFSDAVLTDSSTKKFAESAVAIVAKYDLDGVDIDWEYPGMQGDSNIYRPHDKEGYTMLFKDLRTGLDSLKKITGRRYFISTAVGGSEEYIEHTEMKKVAAYADYINVMSYDYADGSDSMSNHHTNLFTSSKNFDQYSADRSIRAFINAGVPAKKIVIGIAFYGKGWQMRTNDNNGLYRTALKPAHGGGFTYLKDSIINRKGFTRFWDSTAKAPYLFNDSTKVFISYDDEESVKAKCEYVKKYHLGGAMFWEYNDDKKEYLLKTIAKVFNYAVKN